MINDSWNNILEKKEVRSSLSTLRNELKECTKRQVFLKEISEQEIALLLELLKNPDAKTRKNAAALLGDLALVEATEVLFETYLKEETRFVKSTYLSALAQLDICDYLEQLQERYDTLLTYEPLENEKKHHLEELKALELLLRPHHLEQSHTFTGYNQKLVVLLTTFLGYQDITGDRLHVKKKKKSSLGVKAITEDLHSILEERTYRELLFPLTLDTTISEIDTPEEIGKLLGKSELLSLIKRCHKEEGPYYFRVELRNGMNLEERSQYIRKLSVAMEEASNRELLNSTDDYEFEIRILTDREGVFHVFLKMLTIPMDRFAYRKHAISASIHPSTAAFLVELASPYLKSQGQILDPFCGVGTMLIERNQKIVAKEIYGIDIFGEAIDFARENIKLAGMKGNFINRDFFDFKHEYLFDEIITNLPVRGRKTREEMEVFYSKFFDKAKELLKPGGVIVLYSNEEGFVKKQVRLREEYIMMKEYVISKREKRSLFIIGYME